MAWPWYYGLLWRLWKWLVHLFTGQCELYRLCQWRAPLEQRTVRIEQCLRDSKRPALRRITMGTEVEVEEAVDVITREKKISIRAHPSFVQRLKLSLVRICGVRILFGEVEALRAQPYSQEDEEHEKMLMELWSQLMPDSRLESRVTKQWQDIGFQGNNPSTDFRGMGVLGLKCLLYFATAHQEKARSVLSHSHHPQYEYPFAVVGITMTGMVYSWLQHPTLNPYLYTACTQWPATLEEFFEIYCYVFVQFDQFWREKKPENVMAFPEVKTEFEAHLIQRLGETPIRISMHI